MNYGHERVGGVVNNFEKSLIVTVNDVAEPPEGISLSISEIKESNVPGTVVGSLATTKGKAPYTYSLVSGTGSEDNAKFQISGGDLQLNFTPDYESPVDLGDTPGNNTYSVRIRTTDNNSETYEESFVITIGNATDPPTGMTLSVDNIDEGSVSGTKVGDLAAVEGIAPYTYSLVSGTGSEDNAKFQISGTELQLNFIPSYISPTDLGDTAGNNTYAVRVKVTDSGDLYSFTTHTFTNCGKTGPEGPTLAECRAEYSTA